MRYVSLNRSRCIQKSTFIFVIKSIATHKNPVTIYSFAAKNISPHKFNLLTFIIIESIIFKATKAVEFSLLLISLLIYRAMLFSFTITRIVIVFFIIFI